MALPFLRPMLASPGAMPERRDRFGYELKWDGYRALARWDGRSLRLISRNGNDLAERFPELHGIAAALPGPALLDGEIVALDASGRASFSLLQRRLPSPLAAGGAREPVPATYIAFDLLHEAGEDLCPLPYVERRARLEALRLDGDRIRTPPWHRDGDTLLALARRYRIEGIVAKRLDGPYVPGSRTRDWIKIKLAMREEFVVGGYLLAEDRPRDESLRSLVLGYYPREGAALLRYAGHAGRGIGEAERRALQELLDRHRREDPPFDGPLRMHRIRWCDPILVVEVEFQEWTHHGIVRHPTFLGVRDDKEPPEVVRAPPSLAA